MPLSEGICLKKVYFSRGTHTVLDGLSMRVPLGKIVAIIGPSGTGKTTLLNLMTGLIKADAGSVKVAGQEVGDLSRSELYKLRRRIGMLFQSGALFTHLNVFENVAFPLREHTKLTETLLRTHVLLKLEAVGLRGAAHLMPNALSGGMKKRVSFARGSVFDPAYMLWDEPFSAQDPITRGLLMTLIKQSNQTLGMTSVIVSHNVVETMKIADYVYLISAGKVIAQGDPARIMQDSERICASTALVRQFIKGLPDGVIPFHYPALPIEKELMQ